MCDPPSPNYSGGGGVLFCVCTSSNVNVNNIEEERMKIIFYSSFIEFIDKAVTK